MKKYNLFWLPLNSFKTKPFSSDNKKRIWKEIGKSWATYEVRNKKGKILKEFITY